MGDPFDNEAGTKEGVEIWRIEKMVPVRRPKEEAGTFYSGDAYLILHSYKKFNSLEADLFFWLGKDCSQDERGAAAYMTVALDDKLGGKPVQYREVQGHESKKFMALWHGGMRTLDGGIESGFNHVDPDAYEARLLHLKGKRTVRSQQVELKASSMNHGDVFILDLGLTLYQWNGAEANKYEKFKGLEMVTDINDNERGHKAEIVILEDGKDDDEEFWAKLGSKADVKGTDEVPGDDEVKAQEAKLFSVSDASGKMEINEVASGKHLKRDLLNADDCYILDTGTEVYVWVGKGATKDERKHSMEFGTNYLKEQGRPDWTPLSRIPAGGEPPVFKAFFAPWDPPRVVKFGADEVKVEAPKADFSAMYQQRKAAEEKMADDASGSVKIWRIENMAKAEWPENLYGQFYAGDSFIILYSYKKGTKDAWIIYYWQGKDSSNDEKGASALLAKELDDELGGDPVQVRVVQNKEPNHFISLFKNKMVVHEGGIASAFKNRDDMDSYDTDGISLFHVRGTTPVNTRAVQVAEVASSLNSGDCFVLLTPETMYVWQGLGASDDEKQTADNIANILKFNRGIEVVPEGSEPDKFWEALGGKDEYPHSKEMLNPDFEPRLFQGTTAKKAGFIIEEIFDYTQDDLVMDDVMILDAFSEVFVWIGPDSNKTERDNGFQAALDYVKNAGDGRDPDTPVYKLNAGCEPPNFTCHFLGWNDEKASDFEDPYAKKMGALNLGGPRKKKVVKLEKVSADDIGFAKGKTFTYEELKNNTAENVDPKAKQNYLSDADFQEVFKMDKAAFDKMAKWKQDQAKKKVGLF